MVDYEFAKLDPASVFKSPRAVVEDATLTREQKIDILKRWAYDARELAVAEEENMLSKSHLDDENLLHQILNCLLLLGVDHDQTSPPTKQG